MAFDSIKRLWNDPKKRPWLLAGAGVAAGAGIIAARRPVEPADAPVEEGTTTGDGAELGEVVDPSALGPTYYSPGSGMGFPDPAFQEADLSLVFDELDNIGAQLDELLNPPPSDPEPEPDPPVDPPPIVDDPDEPVPVGPHPVPKPPDKGKGRGRGRGRGGGKGRGRKAPPKKRPPRKTTPARTPPRAKQRGGRAPVQTTRGGRAAAQVARAVKPRPAARKR